MGDGRCDYKVQLQGPIGLFYWRLLNQLVPLQLLHLGMPLPFVVPLTGDKQRPLFAGESLDLPPTVIEDSSCEFQLQGAIARCDWMLQVCRMFLTHYEINLDQRILDPEICMAACMAGRPAGWR